MPATVCGTQRPFLEDKTQKGLSCRDGDVALNITPAIFRFPVNVDLFVIGETWIDSDEDGDCDPGEGVAYVSFVENTGITSLNVVTVSDDLLGDETVCDWPYHDQLKPGESITCTGTYEVRVIRE